MRLGSSEVRSADQGVTGRSSSPSSPGRTTRFWVSSFLPLLTVRVPTLNPVASRRSTRTSSDRSRQSASTRSWTSGVRSQQPAMDDDVGEQCQQHQQRDEEKRGQDGGDVGRPLGGRLVVEIGTGTSKRGALIVTAHGPPRLTQGDRETTRQRE